MHDSRKRLFAGAVVVVSGLAVAMAFRKPVAPPAAPPLSASGFTEVAPTGPISGPHIAVEPAQPHLLGRIEPAAESSATTAVHRLTGAAQAEQTSNAADVRKMFSGFDVASSGTLGTAPGSPGSSDFGSSRSSHSPPSSATFDDRRPPDMASSLRAAVAAEAAGRTNEAKSLADLPKPGAGVNPALKPLIDDTGSAVEPAPLNPAPSHTTQPRTWPPNPSASNAAPSVSPNSPNGALANDVAAPWDRAWTTDRTATSLAPQGGAATDAASWRPATAPLPAPPYAASLPPLSMANPPGSTSFAGSNASSPHYVTPATSPFGITQNASSQNTNSQNTVAQNVSPFGPTASAARPIAVDRGRHRVADGDTLDGIARRYYGDAARAGEIYSANRGLLRSPELLPIGAELLIPDGPLGTSPATYVDPRSSLDRAMSAQPSAAQLVTAQLGTIPSGATVAGTPSTARFASTSPSATMSSPFGAPAAANNASVPAGWPVTPSNRSATDYDPWKIGGSAVNGSGGDSVDGAALAPGFASTGWPPKGIENRPAAEGYSFTRGVSATGTSLARFGNTLLGAGDNAPVTTGKTYLVRPLETWETLAARFYGDATKAGELRAANPKLAAASLKPGSVVVVPVK